MSRQARRQRRLQQQWQQPSAVVPANSCRFSRRCRRRPLSSSPEPSLQQQWQQQRALQPPLPGRQAVALRRSPVSGAATTTTPMEEKQVSLSRRRRPRRVGRRARRRGHVATDTCLIGRLLLTSYRDTHSHYGVARRRSTSENGTTAPTIQLQRRLPSPKVMLTKPPHRPPAAPKSCSVAAAAATAASSSRHDATGAHLPSKRTGSRYGLSWSGKRAPPFEAQLSLRAD